MTASSYCSGICETFTQASIGRPARLPSVQTTCSGSSGCTVVCTLVRLAGEALDHSRCPSKRKWEHSREATSWHEHIQLWEHAAPTLVHLDQQKHKPKLSAQRLHHRALALEYPGFMIDGCISPKMFEFIFAVFVFVLFNLSRNKLKSDEDKIVQSCRNKAI